MYHNQLFMLYSLYFHHFLCISHVLLEQDSDVCFTESEAFCNRRHTVNYVKIKCSGDGECCKGLKVTGKQNNRFLFKSLVLHFVLVASCVLELKDR